MKVLLAATLLFSALSLPGQDWPQYLGPHANGLTEGRIHSDWQAQAPKELWRKQIGNGCGSFAIAHGRALTIGNEGDADTLWCLDAKTGEVVWKHSYPEPLDPKMYAGGANATPLVAYKHVYVLSKSGRLACYRLADGELIWEKHYEDDFKGKAPDWGYSASPVIYNKQLLISPCSRETSLMALNPATGETLWANSFRARPGYAAPVITKHKGRDCALVFHGRRLVGYDLEAKGEVMFEQLWRTSYDINASNPHYLDEKVFFASGYGMGYGVISVDKARPKILHKEPDTRLIFQNSLLVDGNIIAVFGDKNIDAELISMDMASGKINWKSDMPGTRGSILQVGENQLLILSETGALITGKYDAKGFQKEGQLDILPSLCWAPLAYADGMVFARNNKGEAVCLELSAQ
ncbi:MAG: PQQ-binding-like beta-propeller repeat protein [Verrucomicrobiales bacterium]